MGITNSMKLEEYDAVKAQIYWNEKVGEIEKKIEIVNKALCKMH